jgi:hypothetical protein
VRSRRRIGLGGVRRLHRRLSARSRDVRYRRPIGRTRGPDDLPVYRDEAAAGAELGVDVIVRRLLPATSRSGCGAHGPGPHMTRVLDSWDRAKGPFHYRAVAVAKAAKRSDGTAREGNHVSVDLVP